MTVKILTHTEERCYPFTFSNAASFNLSKLKIQTSRQAQDVDSIYLGCGHGLVWN